MKAKTFLKGAVAGLMSVSLLLSGMPVMATEADGAKQQTQGTPEDTAGGQQKPSENTAGEQQKPSEDIAGEQQKSSENTAGETEQNVPENVRESQRTEESGTDETDQNTEADSAGKNKSAESETDKNTESGQEKNVKSETGKDTKSEQEENPESETDQGAEALQAFSLESLNVVNGSIGIDGDLSDWAAVTARTSSAANVDSWKVAYSADQSTLYFCYTGSASTEWDYNFGGNQFSIAYADGATGQDSALMVNAWNGGALVKNSYWGDVEGAEAAVTNQAHGNNAGPYTVEFSVPASFFHSLDFTLTFGDTAVSSGDIEQINGNGAVEETPAVYAGITIDGDYSDWAAVAKTDASCPNSSHPGCVSQVAAVFDGDWFYIYIKDGKDSNASGAGTHSNGKFAITSDLGYETDIQLTTAPAVNGVDGAQISYVGSEWELAIPKDQLPKYEESLSFGFYLGEPIVSGLMNLQPDSENNLDNLFNGIIYDGQYEDWTDYGHTTIEYATAGSQESQVDAKGALYADGETLFGHVVTTMPQHLQEAGGEFTSAVTIAFNQNESKLRSNSYDSNMAFYPRYVTVDADGNINWDPQLSGFSEGTYEFYIASTDAWHTSTNINDLNEMDQLYGKMIMTIGRDGKDEMEFYLELPMIAKKLGVDETDLKQISAQFGRIGQQWIYTAGTSTGPVVGIVLCVTAVGLVFWYRKKRTGELPFAVA